MTKARQFSTAAGLVEEIADEEQDLSDACITLHVHAGIAAAARRLLEAATAIS